MSAVELACLSGGAVLWAAWGLLLIACIVVVGLAIQHVIVRRQLRHAVGAIIRHRQYAEELRIREERLRDALGADGFVDILDGVEKLKAELRRATAIRHKTEDRLREQNQEMILLRGGQA